MDGMDDSDHNTSRLPAVVVPRPLIAGRWTPQRPARWQFGGLPDRLLRASRHPAVAGSLAAAGLILHAGLRRALSPRALPPRGRSTQVTSTPPARTDGASVVLVSRTVMVETWTVRSRRS
jgi:hypothetical protein